MLHYIKQHQCKINLKQLRKKFVDNENYKKENSWMLDIPYDVRDEALKDLINNFKSNFGKGGKFNIRFRKKTEHHSMAVLSKHWNHKDGAFATAYNYFQYEGNTIRPNLNYTSRLIKTEVNEYYLCVPLPLNKKCESQAPSCFKTIAMDPGVRTLLTGYDIDGRIIEFGKNDIGRLARLLHYKAKLQSNMTKTNHKHRNKMKKAFLKINKTITNLVTECHKKIAKWLCENYHVILIPKLNFHDFGKMTPKQRAKMAVWSHCGLVKRLEEKACEHPWCCVKIVKEAYTSKTCGRCGELKHNLYNSRVFKCSWCSLVIDRDVNGARNILIKYLTEL